jgi:hypothetical protein
MEETLMRKKTITRRLSGMVLTTVIACALVALSGQFYSALAIEGNVTKEVNETSTILSVMGYGFSVKVLINGKDAGIKGGKSENKRLFFTDSVQLDEMPPEMRGDYQLLKRGENTFIVEFSRQPDSQSTGLDVSLSLDNGSDIALFTITDEGKASGKVEKKVTIL